MATLADAGLTRYPFRTVPPMEPTNEWFGRPAFHGELASLVRKWAIRPDSTIHLLWADFGAGKTHALRHLEYMANCSEPPTLCVYTDLPKAASDFRGVYEQIIPQIPEDVLIDAVYAFRAKEGDHWLSVRVLNGDRDTPRALWMLAQMQSQSQGDIARRWLRGERCTASELRMIDNLAPIRSSDQATRTLGTICRLIARYSSYHRIAIMLDEFQRIGQSNTAKIRELNAGIHTWFNSCPDGLSIVLAYSIGVPETIKLLVTSEVQSRVTGLLTLPKLVEDDAIEFVVEMLVAASNVDGKQKAFMTSAIVTVIRRLASDTHGDVTPRKLMQAFSVVLDAALEEPNVKFPITEAEATKWYEPPVADTLLS